MQQPFKLFLLTCVGVQTPELIPHFIRYYQSLGVDEFLIVLHCDALENPNRAVVMDALAAFGIQPRQQWVGTFLGPEKQARLNALVASCVDPGDWVINADLDEFVECDRFSRTPADLRKLLSAADANGFTFIPGRFVDMVALGGELNHICADVPLWEQFPIACNVSETILGAAPRKIVACKGHHRCEPGAHRVLEQPRNRAPALLRVNHFKWDQTVTARLAQREADYTRAGFPHAIESARFLKHIRAHGRINLRLVEFIGRSNPLNGWSIPAEMLKFMVLHVPAGASVLELGSGRGTQELSWFFRMHSVEHDPKWVGKYASQYIYAPINGGWYDRDAVRAGIKSLQPAAVLVDGPPSRIGREGFARHLDLFDTSGWILFDDVNRPRDRDHFNAVCERLADRRHEVLPGGGKEFGVIYPVAPLAEKL
ncbi:MAG: hypothetical protein QOF78_703 [Phycisphaerales bacterium]|jgi:hypothetical protein|nr:hypothetical protein [Phycisphaerales bacterium]